MPPSVSDAGVVTWLPNGRHIGVITRRPKQPKLTKQRLQASAIFKFTNPEVRLSLLAARSWEGYRIKFSLTRKPRVRS